MVSPPTSAQIFSSASAYCTPPSGSPGREAVARGIIGQRQAMFRTRNKRSKPFLVVGKPAQRRAAVIHAVIGAFARHEAKPPAFRLWRRNSRARSSSPNRRLPIPNCRRIRGRAPSAPAPQGAPPASPLSDGRNGTTARNPSRRPASWIACTMAFCAWPAFTHHRPEIASSTRRPFASR